MKIKNNYTKVNYTKGRAGNSIKWIVIHNTANGTSKEGTAKNNTIYFKNVNRNASAHFFIDDGSTIWRCVKNKHTAWHCGDGSSGSAGKKGCRNYNSTGIEVCEPKNGIFTKKEQTTLRELVMALMKKYNVPAERVVRHSDVSGKSCPWYYASHDSKWKELHAYITGTDKAAKTTTKTTTTKATTAKTTTTKKSVTEIAKEVVNGKWGNGDTRKTKLKKAGYDYAAVQKKVNELLKK